MRRKEPPPLKQGKRYNYFMLVSFAVAGVLAIAKVSGAGIEVAIDFGLREKSSVDAFGFILHMLISQFSNPIVRTSENDFLTPLQGEEAIDIIELEDDDTELSHEDCDLVRCSGHKNSIRIMQRKLGSSLRLGTPTLIKQGRN
ncbi:hypothetical protein Ahy_B06g082337 isoform A [Arachis hypogaea]|uniref:Uncharacterized protein n=1 Tax=Arachis hypogaea TaxID=3818 RepID=A0A444YN85_ARAHY|nr:hypothetical protein Ahy_B06g082337 isoform A [Arachis hypogaea]